MNKEEVYKYLQDRGIAFEATEHKAVYNMAEVKEIELPYPEYDAKNLFVRDDKKRGYYMITVKGDKRVSLGEFRREHGLRQLSFASPDDLMKIMGLIPGAVTPLGLLNDSENRVKLYMDKEFENGKIGVHPNDNTATIWMLVADLVKVIQDSGNEVEFVEIQ